MLNRLDFIKIADLTTAEFLSESEGAIDIANNTLSNIYVELVLMRSFVTSTGKKFEYLGWKERFKKANPDACSTIKNNLWMEETE